MGQGVDGMRAVELEEIQSRTHEIRQDVIAGSYRINLDDSCHASELVLQIVSGFDDGTTAEAMPNKCDIGIVLCDEQESTGSIECVEDFRPDPQRQQILDLNQPLAGAAGASPALEQCDEGPCVDRYCSHVGHVAR